MILLSHATRSAEPLWSPPAQEDHLTAKGKSVGFLKLLAIAALLLLPGQVEAKSLEAELGTKTCEELKKEAATGVAPADLSKTASKGATWCTAKTKIKAPPEIVWRAVHEERQNDPDIAYSKVIEQNENQLKLEQKFCFIPFLGTSTCVTHQVEVPNQRIDYKLVKSDHFKAMEGSWVLNPADNGKSTELVFSSHLDLGLPVPKMLMDGVTSKKMEKRLAHIKQIAEKNHAALAATAAQTVQ
jgi:ribosome-associated toxin RatA of RatAB toxin-antitoxin module